MTVLAEFMFVKNLQQQATGTRWLFDKKSRTF